MVDSAPKSADDKQQETTKVVPSYFVVHFSGNGFDVHSATPDKGAAHRVARSVNGYVLTLTKGE